MATRDHFTEKKKKKKKTGVIGKREKASKKESWMLVTGKL